jgi:hypothetical protein
VIHLRAGHEHHVRREREQHRREQGDARSFGLHTAREGGEAPDSERATEWHRNPGCAEQHADGEHRGSAWRELREYSPVSLDEVQRAEQLRHGIESTRDASTREDASLKELSHFVDEQRSPIEHPLRRQRVERERRESEQRGRQSWTSRPQPNHRLKRVASPEPLRAA